MKDIIIEKAYVVWHEGMLSDNPYEGYRMDELPIVYANSANEAKIKSTEVHDFLINDEEHQYIDIRVKRSPKNDKIEFEGSIKTKNQIEFILSERKRISERRFKIDQYPDNSKFFVQNGYVGNNVLWWAKNSCGYTTDINKAHLYTKEEILKSFIDGRREDIIWLSDHVLENVKTHVDGQYLSKGYSA